MSAATRAFDALELLQNIMRYLPPSTMVRCRQVSPSWKAAVDTPSLEMKWALSISSESPIIDLWTPRRPKTCPAKKSQTPLGTPRQPYFFPNLTETIFGVGEIEIRAQEKKLSVGNQHAWFEVLFPNPSNWNEKVYAPKDLRREMLISEPPVNHVEVTRFYSQRTIKSFVLRPDCYKIVQPGGVKLKHILEHFEGEEAWRMGRRSTAKGSRDLLVGLWRDNM